MNTRKYLFGISNLLLTVILAACGGLTSASPSPLPGSTGAPVSTGVAVGRGACSNAYYPIGSGDTWTYSSVGDTAVGPYTYTRTVSDLGSAGFTTDDKISNGIDWVVKWTCQAGNLTAFDTGMGTATMTTSKVKVNTSSATATGFNIPASFDKGKTWSETVTLNTAASNGSKTVNKQIVSQLDCSGGDPALVVVPAGKFSTVTANCSKTVSVSATIQGKTQVLASNHENIVYSYAKGVGYVKSVASGGNDNETVVLTNFKAP